MPTQNYKNIIDWALKEDETAHDITTDAIFGKKDLRATGDFYAKQDLILSGLDVTRSVFFKISPQTKLMGFFKNGALVRKGEKIATVKGSLKDLLRGERVALNFLQHLSGVATLTFEFVQKVKGFECKILDTRKTIPGLRSLEKQAVCDGGGHNHRMNLADEYLIKNNHVDACESLTESIERVKKHQKKLLTKKLLVVETRNLGEVKEALGRGVDVILLDNMNPEQIREACALVQKKCLLEVSGGVNLKNVQKYAATGVDRISVGALTHSAPAADIHFTITPVTR